MKILTEWLIITIGFAIGAWISHAMIGGAFNFSFVGGLSLGWLLCAMYTLESVKKEGK